MTTKLSQRELKDVLRGGSGDRCNKCGRVVTWRFQELGLGVVRSKAERTPDGDVYLKHESYHTFPCVGMKIQLRDVIAHYLTLVSEQSPPPPSPGA